MNDLPAIVLLLSTVTSVDAAHFGPWTAGCDNTGICAAQVVLHPVGEQGGERLPVVLRVVSHPAPNHQPVIELIDLAINHDRRAAWSQVDVSVPTSALSFGRPDGETRPLARFNLEAQGNGVYRLPQEQTWAVMGQLRLDTNLMIEMPDGSVSEDEAGRRSPLGQNEGLSPFSGLLHWWDAEREVSGTPYALGDVVHDGPDMPAPVPDEPENVVRMGFAALPLREIPQPSLAALAGCARAGAIKGYKLGPETVMWQNSCISAEGIRRTDLWLDRGGKLKRLVLPDQGDAPLESIGIEPRRGIIRAFASGGPNDDCGIGRAWGWTGEKFGFRLIERLEMPLCVGIPRHLWLRTWRTDSVGFDD